MSLAVLGALALFGLSAPPVEEPIRIAVAPLVLTAQAKFAGKDIEGTRGHMQEAAMDYLRASCDETGYGMISNRMVNAAMEDLHLDFTKSNQRTREKLQAFGRKAGADYAILMLVDWTEQKNPEISAVLGNMNKAKSSNKVRARIWLQNVAEDRLMLDGSKQTITAEALGPYFGTTNERDMSGDPTAKGIAIANEYRKRGQWLGRALVQALRESVKPALGLKEPPDR